MGENIANRVGRLISGSLNAIVDAAENASAEIVMNESIREVDSAIEEVRHELGKVVVSQHITQERIDSEQQKFQELHAQIKVALQENREDLAEVAISKQMDIEAQLPIMKKNLTESSENIEELESYIVALQAKKREMQEEMQTYKAQSASSSSTTNETSKDVSQAESAFNRVMGINVAHTKHTDEAKLAELEELTRKNRIQERLNALKAASE